jgi:hypothetical protein
MILWRFFCSGHIGGLDSSLALDLQGRFDIFDGFNVSRRFGVSRELNILGRFDVSV